MREIIQDGNRFVIKEKGDIVGEITYVTRGEKTLIIDHTQVAAEFRGQKLAEQLVKRVVDYARETNRMIVPACLYAHSQFRRHKEYEDVWQKTEA